MATKSKTAGTTVASKYPEVLFVSETYDRLDRAKKSGYFVLLHGPGGYAKTRITQDWAKANYAEDEIYTKTISRGTRIADLLGGIDLDALNGKNGKPVADQYNLENSFMSKKCVILEEALDMDLDGLCVLKDILEKNTRKFRNGNQQFDIKTEMFIICTNRDPDQLLEEAQPQDKNAYQAFFERFQIKFKVDWPSKGLSDYKQFLQWIKDNTIVKEQFHPTVLDSLATWLSRKPEAEKISPRSIRYALEHVVHNADQDKIVGGHIHPKDMKVIGDFPEFGTFVTELSTFIRAYEEKKKTSVKIDGLLKSFADAESKIKVDPSHKKDGLALMKTIKDELSAITVGDDLHASKQAALTKFEQTIVSLK